MAWLESLAQGLRGAGGILDQNVYQEGLRDERLKEVEYSRRRDLIAQQIVKGMESGAIPQEQWAGAQETLGKLGYPNMPVGLSLAAQAQQEEIKKHQQAMQQDAMFRQEVSQLPPEARSNPVQLASVFFKHGKADVGARLLDAAEIRASREQQKLDQLKLQYAQLEEKGRLGDQSNETKRFLGEQTLALRQSIAQQEHALGLMRVEISRAAHGGGAKPGKVHEFAEGVFREKPDGSLERMMDPDDPTKPLRPKSLTQGDRGDRRDAMAIYRETENDPQVKTYKALTPKFDTSTEYFDKVSKNPKEQSNAADALIAKTYISMIHPKGDNISNQEAKDYAKQANLQERIVGAITNAIDGKQLQPEMRADIMKLMRAQYGKMNSQIVGIEDRRREEATRFKLNPDDAVPKIGRRQTAAPKAAPTPAAGGGSSIDDIIKRNL